jgi:N-hydroxyarylamine O-acetyltransferase
VSLFDTASFDLEAYFGRLGYGGPASPDLPTLQAIARAHPAAIPFENLNPLLRRPVPLDSASLQQKLVRSRRGGWCFEHNLLLGTALRAVGYAVSGLAARVMWNAPAGFAAPRGHMVLYVDLGGQPYIVDAGFGGLTLTGPLRLEAGVEQDTPHEPCRLERAAGDFVLEARIGGGWKPLYRFDLQRQALADYEVTNWYLSTHPRSHFLATLMAARAQADRRYALRNTELAVHHRDGYTERRVLASGAEIRETLDTLFGIDVPAGADVDAAFARLIGEAATT